MDVVSEVTNGSHVSYRSSASNNPTSSTGRQNTTTTLVCYRKAVLAPDQVTKVSEYSPRTVKTLNIIVSIFLTLIALFVFLMVFPLVSVYMYPHAMFNLFPQAKWKPTSLFKLDELNITSNYTTGFSRKLKAFGTEVEISYHTLRPPTNRIYNIYDKKQALIVLDSETIPGYPEFFVCRPTQSYDYYSFQDYRNMVKTCYLYVRQITRSATIFGYGNGIGANILAYAAVGLQETHCFMFEKVFLENPIINLLGEMRNHKLINLVFFIPPLRNFIVNYVIKTQQIENVDIIQNLLKIPNTTVSIIHEDAKFRDDFGVQIKRNKNGLADSQRLALGAFRNLNWNSNNQQIEHMGRQSKEVYCAQTKRIPISSVLA